jgi:hypothetical protein
MVSLLVRHQTVVSMRILFLSQLVPYPLDAGPKVRSYYVLRWLAEAGHEYTLLSELHGLLSIALPLD